MQKLRVSGFKETHKTVKKLNRKNYNSLEEFKKVIDEQLDKLRDKKIDQIEIINISFEELKEIYGVNVFDHSGFSYCACICNDGLIVSGDTKSAFATIERDDCVEE